MRGISLFSLRATIAHIASNGATSALTAADFHTTVIRPYISANKRPFIDQFISDTERELPEESVSPTLFVCHSWAAPFLQTLRVVADNMQDLQHTHVWVDILNTTNAAPDGFLDELYAQYTLPTHIRNCGHFALICTLWPDQDKPPAALLDPRCLWQTYLQSTLIEAPVVVLLPSQPAVALRDGMFTAFHALLDQFSHVDLMKCPKTALGNASVLSSVWAACGPSTFNDIINRILKQWFLASAGDIAAEFIAAGNKNEADLQRTANLYVNIGVELRRMGNPTSALAALDDSMKLYDKTPNTFGPRFLQSVFRNFALAHLGCRSYEKALDYYNRLVILVRADSGDDQPEMADVLDGIADVYVAQSKPADAVASLERALVIRTAALGQEHQSVAVTRLALGHVLLSMDMVEEAQDNFEDALKMLAKLLGENSAATATARSNLGLLWYKDSRLAQAQEMFEKCLKARIEVFGHNSVEVANTYKFEHGHSQMHALGKHEKAVELFKLAIDCYVQTVGESHGLVAETYNNLGLARCALGEHEQAIESYDKALSIRLATTGQNSPETANSYNFLGLGYGSKGAYAESLDSFHRCLDIQMATIGADHVDTAATHANLALVYLDLGDGENAKKHAHLSYDIIVKAYPAYHKEVSRARRLLDSVSRGQRDRDRTCLVM